MANQIFDPVVPYSGPIYGGKFHPGQKVRIQGVIPAVAYSFDVNLQRSSALMADDIAIHVSVRILDGLILFNSSKHGVWGEELRQRDVFIKRGAQFEIALICDFNKYIVIINGRHRYDFPQRIHYDHITHLTIYGDVSVFKIIYDPLEDAESRNYPSRVSNESASLLSPLSVEDDFNRNGLAYLTVNQTSSAPEETPPPSYKDCEQSVAEPPLLNPRSTSVSHRIDVRYPVDPPYPISTSSLNPPYPVRDYGIPQPYNLDGVTVRNASGYSPSATLNVPPPSRGAPVPLNAVTPPVTVLHRPQPRSLGMVCLILLISMLLGLAICLIILHFIHVI